MRKSQIVRMNAMGRIWMNQWYNRKQQECVYVEGKVRLKEGKGRIQSVKAFEKQTRVKVSRMVKIKRSSVRQKQQSQEPCENLIL
jgi:hypothetical protein